MDEDMIEPTGPATTIECPWCGGDVELRHGADGIACERCLIVVAIAPDAARGAADASRLAIATAA